LPCPSATATPSKAPSAENQCMDIVTPSQRSRMMSGIRSRDTGPEITVRRIAHAMGLRFRLHQKRLPGTPDLVFPRWHLAIFVHGCFWHRHPDCHLAAVPKTRADFWSAKFERNVARDRRVCAALEELGWKVGIIWECETRDSRTVQQRVSRMLTGKRQRTFASAEAGISGVRHDLTSDRLPTPRKRL
jgi:DNA mismatch endonuclease, patch repair protein